MRTLATTKNEHKPGHYFYCRRYPLERWQLSLAVESLTRNWRRNFLRPRIALTKSFHRNGFKPGANRLGPTRRKSEIKNKN
jgi:hypothetical protein